MAGRKSRRQRKRKEEEKKALTVIGGVFIAGVVLSVIIKSCI
jgi:hypothetical protein